MADLQCPICRRSLPQGRATPAFPFCSPRCKLVDLGNWLGDGYVIAGPMRDDVDAFDEDALQALFREPS